MNANPHTAQQRARFGGNPPSTSMRWTALHDAGNAVAMLAGRPPQRMTRELRNFPALIRDAGGWRQEEADNAIADLSAVMEPGLAALLAVNARGADPQAAAKALWREFERARDAVLALLPPAGELGPPRSA